MKRSGSCPKCYHRVSYRIDRVAAANYESTNGIDVRYLHCAKLAAEATGLTGTTWRSEASELEAYVCAGCGLIEWYAAQLADLEALSRHPGSGVTVCERPADGPYR